MDDLTTLPLIGKATAKKLVAAGIDSIAKVAGAGHADLRAVLTSASSDDLQKLQDAATAKLAPAPPSRQMTNDELRDLVSAWDNARAELNTAGDLVAEIQTKLAALAPDADRRALDDELVAAQARVAAAHETIAALTPLPDGVTLPDARKNEIPAGPQGPAGGQVGDHTQPHQQAAQGPGEVSDKDAALETGAVAGVSDLISITVIGPARGRRRAGFEFNATPQTVMVTADQLKLIDADKNLAVSSGTLPPAADVAAVRERLAAEDFTFKGPLGRITVLGPANGRRRAGFEFGAMARTVEVNADQLKLILADDSLAVTPA